jgi:hypothetical protein
MSRWPVLSMTNLCGIKISSSLFVSFIV